MKITELNRKAYQNALAEEREAEWNNENVDEKTLVDFSLMNGTEYDSDGHFIEYHSSSTQGDYSPSNPWDAPGMSIRDFI